MRTIHLPAIDRVVRLGAYVQAVKTAKANPNRTFRYGLTCRWPVTGVEIIRQFHAGLHGRINQAVPYAQGGRTFD